jgi:hypothetical protein
MKIRTEATITCPHCHYQAIETMPEDRCQIVYVCKNCEAILKPQRGDCCVFCSYADVPCPPIQEEQSQGSV